jgi:hypothetical protein
MGVGRHDFITCLTILPPSMTQSETWASGQTRLGALSNGEVLLASGHMSPRTPNSMYSSAEYIPLPPDVVARPGVQAKCHDDSDKG